MSNILCSIPRRVARPDLLQRADFQQVRHATLLRRPKRPYTFTQLVTLTDGSTYMHRTTSPQPVYTSTKDVRNSPLWNPSSEKLLNVEEDEAGKLRAFRERFGRGWDADAAAAEAAAGDEASVEQEDDSLLDLISGYQPDANAKDGGQMATMKGFTSKDTKAKKK
ncbi:hypothetical protein EJ06DRAFT_494916 [Trichodelitschia bisporula]|uniref:Ribosomal protein bL31m N-terminal domain-containing protein n=1 Tax=Trichodelitschia bisporula TaxID=703511 RepID=A0A6G1HVG4_9PEZI|nr:hypothetical protein EJ06DRAFT_494916 [Trichodelitschia bisporula]